MKWQLRAIVALSFLATAAACEPAADEAPATDASIADTVASAPEAPATDALIDPNEATVEQLTAIPALNDSLAARIVAGAPYENMLEVDAILATELDEAQRDEVYARVWKRIDLNTASEEEILLIPGIGDRMLHEFQEYRPYTAIEQFRREMGKYVDDEEVARMERYVEVREADATE